MKGISRRTALFEVLSTIQVQIVGIVASKWPITIALIKISSNPTMWLLLQMSLITWFLQKEKAYHYWICGIWGGIWADTSSSVPTQSHMLFLAFIFLFFVLSLSELLMLSHSCWPWKLKRLFMSIMFYILQKPRKKNHKN